MLVVKSVSTDTVCLWGYVDENKQRISKRLIFVYFDTKWVEILKIPVSGDMTTGRKVRGYRHSAQSNTRPP